MRLIGSGSAISARRWRGGGSLPRLALGAMAGRCCLLNLEGYCVDLIILSAGTKRFSVGRASSRCQDRYEPKVTLTLQSHQRLLSMEIHAIFDSHFTGQSCDAVWIVDSPANRIWFDEAKGSLDPNSALFRVESHKSVQLALCYMIWGIVEHFPEWQKICVTGIVPATSVPSELLDVGRWEAIHKGLVLLRI